MVTHVLSSIPPHYSLHNPEAPASFDKLIKRADAQLERVAQRWMPRAMLVADITWSDKKDLRTAYLHISYGFAEKWQVPWAVRVWEVAPPAGKQPIEWIIPSHTALSCLEDALNLLESTSYFILSYAVI